ncbi:MAG: heme ABC exporter ATP-binding protein CcmA [Nitrospinota bacterium]|nr:heme ABC exporter ATP-binding protein CcmA [Nitrospinota bacterium]MDH5757466.1 heme ABC exporter ATP-binding protein CcmA [Nitrospinota bacterium]
MESANSPGPAVELDQVVKRFGYMTAVDKISLTLEKGEFLTIFGPNGAGKTTLIRIMAGLTAATSGSARINGRPVQDHDDEARRDIGLISHQTFSYGQLTAMENLLFFARLYGVEDPSARCQALLEEVGLSKRSHEPVRSFSRGMVQRLSIARSLVHDPSILLLDEPFTGLDQHAAETLKRQLRRLKDERRTLVMITHNLEQGVALGTRVVLQVAGKIILDQPASTIDVKEFGQVYFNKVGQAHY